MNELKGLGPILPGMVTVKPSEAEPLNRPDLRHQSAPDPSVAEGEACEKGSLQKREVFEVPENVNFFEISTKLGDIEVVAGDFQKTRLIRDIEIKLPENEARALLAKLGGLSPDVNGIIMKFTEPALNINTQNPDGSVTIPGFQMGKIVAGRVTVHRGGNVGNVNTRNMTTLNGQVISGGEVPQGVQMTVKYRLEIPSGKGGSLTLDSASGNIKVENTNGNASVRSASGNVELLNIVGRVDLITTSGDISISGANCENMQIESNSGDVDVESSRGKLEIITRSGGVRITNQTGEITAKTKSGEVRVEGELANDVALSTTSGEITVIAQEGISVSARSLSGDVRNKLGHSPDSPIHIIVTSVSGDITVRKLLEY